MKGFSGRTYSTNYFQRLTLERWYTNLQQMPHNRCQQVPMPYKRLIQDKNETDKRSSNRLTNRPMKMTNFARVFQQVSLRLNWLITLNGLAWYKHHRLTSTIRYLQKLFIREKNNSYTPCVPMFLLMYIINNYSPKAKWIRATGQ